MRIDLSQFKKAGEDQKSATLIHPDGHKITVSKQSLSAKMRSKLAELPSHLAEGGEAEESDQAPMQAEPVQGQEAAPQAPQEAPVTQAPMPQNPVEMWAPPAEEAARAPAGVMAPAAAQPGNISIPQPVNPNQPLQVANQNQMQGLEKAFNQQEQGIQQGVQAQQAKAVAETTAADKYEKDMQSLLKDRKNVMDVAFKSIASINDKIEKGEIKPDRYMTDKTVPQRIATAIGLILGGIGGGLTHQENPALKFLNSQIDRDVQAQRDEMSKNQNILAGYYKQLGSMNDAMAMTKAFYTDMYANQLRKATAASGSQQAQANGAIALGQLEQQKAGILGPLAMKNAVLNNNTIDPSMKIKFLVPEGQQHEAYKDLQTMQNMTKGRDDLLSAFDRVAQINTMGNRAMNPVQSGREIDAIVEPLVAQLAKDSAGRYTEQDAAALKNFFKKVGESDATTAAKKQQLLNFTSQKMNFPSLMPLGIKPPAPVLKSLNAPANYRR